MSVTGGGGGFAHATPTFFEGCTSVFIMLGDLFFVRSLFSVFQEEEEAEAEEEEEEEGEAHSSPHHPNPSKPNPQPNRDLC